MSATLMASPRTSSRPQTGFNSSPTGIAEPHHQGASSARSARTSGDGSTTSSSSRRKPSVSIHTTSHPIAGPSTTANGLARTITTSYTVPGTKSTYKRKSRAKVRVLGEDGTVDGGPGGREKKTRQSQSCDGCRVRKVRCIPLNEEEELTSLGTVDEVEAGPVDAKHPFEPARPGSSHDTTEHDRHGAHSLSTGSTFASSYSRSGKIKGKPIVPCKACHTLGLVCAFDYVPRKRGPPNLYMKRLRDAGKTEGTADEDDPEYAEPSTGFDFLPEEDRPQSDFAVPNHRPSVSHSYTYPNATDFLPRSRTGARQPSGTYEIANRLDGHVASNAAAGRPSLSYNDTDIDKIMGPPTYMSNNGNGRFEVPTLVSASPTALPGTKPILPDGDSMLGISAPSPSETGLSSIMRYTNADRPSPISGMGMGMGSQYEHPLTPTSSFMRSTAVEDGIEAGGARAFEGGSLEGDQWRFPSTTPRHSIVDLKGNYGSAGMEAQYHSSPSEILDDRSSFTGSSRMHSERREVRGVNVASNELPVHVGKGSDGASSVPSHLAAEKGSNGFPAHITEAFSAMTQHADQSTWTPSSGTLGGSFRRTGDGGSGASGLIGPPSQSTIGNLLDISSYPSPSLPPGNPLDAYVPRPLLQLVIGLFFDYVYPLIPCLHRPTFLQDLMNKREERPGEEEWTSLVLAVVASTLVQVPKAFVPLCRKDVRDLAYKCYQRIRRWSMYGHKNVTVTTVTITYLTTVYNFVRGEHATCHASLGETQALCIFLRLHEEESYMYLNPIERELRRRIFFLTFGADKSESVLLGRPIKMREEDCYALRLPEEIDDEYITATSYLSQPPGVTSVITGFNAATRVMCLIGRVMIKHREDKRDPPSGARLQSRLDEVSRLLDEMMSVMDHCPPALRLKTGMDSRAQSPAGGWDTEASAQLQALFFDPTTDRRKAKDAFIVQQGNIYVTQQLGRFVLLQYRNDLLALRNGGLAQNTAWQSIGGVPLGAVGGPVAGTAQTENEKLDREGLCYDMLTVLHSLPIQSIAVNGPSLVTKIRYQAASLLDSVAINAQKDESRGESDSSATLRAQTYLLEFLSILSEIEKHYLLEDDEIGM